MAPKSTALTNTYETREGWLNAAVNNLRPHYAEAAFPLPDKIRAAIGFPSTGRKGKRIAECWDPSASGDGYVEIFIIASYQDPVEILGFLCHELAHAAAPKGAGHGPEFKKVALAVGLEGKMRQALPGLELKAQLFELAAKLGPIPHSILDINGGASDKPKKQTTRLVKCECPDCGYIVRTTQKWIDEKGAPWCSDGNEMIIS
jgi:hypothetical protein